jgi:CBS domain containing-hemolysin-like protein
MPKSFARNHNLKYMQFSIYLIYSFYIFFFPITKLLNILSKNKKEKIVSENELSALIDIVKREGVLETQEANLVKNAIEFDDTSVEKLLTNIKDMEYVKYENNNKNILDKFLSTDYSRLPVIDLNNKCIGILNYKQFNKEYYKNKNFDIKTILHPIASVSKNTNLNVVLRLMQISQNHMIVIKEDNEDESIVGFITLENVLEVLVGKINDETDDFKMIQKINDYT